MFGLFFSSKSDKPRKYWVHMRMGIIGALLTVMLFGVIARVYFLQTVETDSLRKKAETQSVRKLKMKAKRGSIYDRNGVELAVSVEAPSIAARPPQIEDPEKTADALAKIFDLDRDDLLKKLRSKRGFLWIIRQTTPAQAMAVSRLHIKGLEVEIESRRFYPLGPVAGQLLGFTNIDGLGLEGVEKAYESHLAGKEFEIESVRDARGRTLLTDDIPEFSKFEGASLELTIDERIQRVAETELERSVTENRALGGYAIAIDVKTGEILAMANTPKFNPNFFRDYTSGDWRLRNVTDTMEPGSVIKPLVLAAALQEKTTKLSTLFDCENGRIKIGKYTIRDSHRSSVLSAAEVIQHSSNICSYKIAQTIGKQKLYDYLRAFGFGSRLGVKLRGEQPGLVWPPDKWAEVSFANIAFGQGFTATPLQTVAAIGAIANGGLLMKPQIVKEIVNKEGEVIEKQTPTLIRRVVSPEVAKEVAWALSLVSREGGTATRSAMKDYTVAGKTGTAQKVNPRTRRYDPHMWIGSFVGFVPAEQPEVAIAVFIDEPQESHYGGVVAAPVFKKIAEEALKVRGVTPLPKSERFRFYDQQEAKSDYLAKQAERLNQMELPDLELPEEELPPLNLEPTDGNVMPDLTGLTLRQALEKSRESGFLPNVTGWGKVVAQSPPSGTPLEGVKGIDIQLGQASAGTTVAVEPSRGDIDSNVGDNPAANSDRNLQNEQPE